MTYARARLRGANFGNFDRDTISSRNDCSLYSVRVFLGILKCRPHILVLNNFNIDMSTNKLFIFFRNTMYFIIWRYIFLIGKFGVKFDYLNEYSTSINVYQ